MGRTNIDRIQGPGAWGGIIEILKNLMNMCFTAVGLAEGTNSATVLTANTATYLVDGVHKTKGATDNIAIPAGTTIAVSKFCKFLVSLDADGDFTVTQGTQAATAALALLPDCPDDNTPVGYFQIATGASNTYVPGTTDNAGAGITDTYVDLGAMPNEL